jgi:hypothetical protein
MSNVWFAKIRPYVNARPWFFAGSKDMPAN